MLTSTRFVHIPLANARLVLLTLVMWFCASCTSQAKSSVNMAVSYPVTVAANPLVCHIDPQHILHPIQRGVFGTNLEWFNEAGGLASHDHQVKDKLFALAKQQGITTARFPGGILADYYHWKDGIGPMADRPKVQHYSDSGRSENVFGSPEFFAFLKHTNAQGLVTVNAGTGTAQEAANWVAYANQKNHPLRLRDGIAESMHIPYWEVGNELYFPDAEQNPVKIALTPQAYAARYLAFSKAMRAQDPSIKIMGIGLMHTHQGPDSVYQDWTEILLKKAASELDMVAVHNAYFPMLYVEHQPKVSEVYPALWASPEAVDKGLTDLEALIARHETTRPIGIAITEWGALFSLPNVDNQWLDHVKTMGTGVYVGRMLQVMLSHPKVEVANYFKLTDRSFMGWINYQAEAKVPYWVFALYANYTGQQRVGSQINSPRYNASKIGIMAAQSNVSEVTSFASVDNDKKVLYVNFVNRSLNTAYPIKLDIKNALVGSQYEVFSVQAKEPTAHNGRDLPPEWPYDVANEPYTTAEANSVRINKDVVTANQALTLAPFSVMTVVVPLRKS